MKRQKNDGEMKAAELPPGNNAIDDLKALASYCQGMADALENETLERASVWLDDAAANICSAGVFGCEGGRDCTSDHK